MQLGEYVFLLPKVISIGIILYSRIIHFSAFYPLMWQQSCIVIL